MNNILIIGLKILRKSHGIFFDRSQNRKPECIEGADLASYVVYDSLMNDQPCMIAGFRNTELNCLVNYIGVKDHGKDYLKYIQGKTQSWWWDNTTINQLQQFGGFFPEQNNKIEQFCELMVQDIPEVNILSSRFPHERLFDKELMNCEKIKFELLNPYFTTLPWTMALKGKKVLVVHPLVDTIEKQYLKRDLLFKNDLLPEFEMQILQASVSIAENLMLYKDWFEVLDYMKTEIDKQEYDICLIGGCGAYGFPLAAHVKRMGKKSIELGGSLQLLFGIWDEFGGDFNYNLNYHYAQLVNEHWIKTRNGRNITG
ncbi:hypothetical protein [Flavobacterium cellulosilyticum]|uniref:Uncharacterized protein n=1 Tax=Flavobacterium cellulosilyticum TaxID=2541731 RepID=A0A4R5CD19_9FLAO|nr:hypothetical protein [Flavobacterium cellulosilyticum]TDD95064.1 hypothetical protein E0F76_14890 [Flavobacterium cellulosilyticum]